ncbi:MAG TPA: endolytic transglycosylase MltG [Rhodothermales bacterium]|nr:endolytic transglycosylase MltG [Rhodothermales bacterium]
MLKKWALILAIPLILILLVAGAGYWIVFAPNTELYEGERDVYIPREATFEQVTDSLVSSDVLASRTTFEWFGKATGWADQVKAGHYTFRAGASNHRILDKIRRGLQSPVQLRIPSGTRPEVMAAVAGKYMAFPPQDFEAALKDSALAKELGTDTDNLFAYMLPETYFFYWLTGAPAVVRKVKAQFDQFYKADIAAKADSLGLSKNEVVTLASIVEWETGVEAEKPRIAAVYLNRLRKHWPLQADPTVQYAIMQKEGRKRRLFNSDYEIQSRYNTYLFQGLPPGPITNPSASTIRAVVNPEQNDYMYFVAKGDGTHIFSRTYSEHLRAVARYRALMRERRREQSETQQQAP